MDTTMSFDKLLESHIEQYLTGYKVPKISAAEARWLAYEITMLVMYFQQDPYLTYEELWDKIHGVEEE